MGACLQPGSVGAGCRLAPRPALGISHQYLPGAVVFPGNLFPHAGEAGMGEGDRAESAHDFQVGQGSGVPPRLTAAAESRRRFLWTGSGAGNAGQRVGLDASVWDLGAINLCICRWPLFIFGPPTTVPQFFCPVGGMRPAGTAVATRPIAKRWVRAIGGFRRKVFRELGLSLEVADHRQMYS